MNEDWVIRLKAGFEAGYYRTEAAVEAQMAFPWQNKRCRDCPFWLNNVCRVDAAPRSPDAHTCLYFDAENHASARRIIDQRMNRVRRAWWDQLGR